MNIYIYIQVQRQQPTSGGTVRSYDLKIVVISSLQTVSSTVFRTRVRLQQPHQPSESSRPRQRLMLSDDVHQNPGPATKYPCSVCTSNVTSRGVSYMCNRCSGWVHSTCSGLQNAAEYRRIKNWACSSPPTPPILQPLPSPITTKTSDGDPFTILQSNANGIGNKQVELGEFLERHTVKVAVIQKLKLTLNSRTPNIQNFTTGRKDRHRGQGGCLLTLINFSRRPDSPDSHLEELTITDKLVNTDLIITNVYIPPASSCTGGYNPSLGHLMMTTDTLILTPNDTAYKRWSCHISHKQLTKLC